MVKRRDILFLSTFAIVTNKTHLYHLQSLAVETLSPPVFRICLLDVPTPRTKTAYSFPALR